jgi:hypothetical protein
MRITKLAIGVLLVILLTLAIASPRISTVSPRVTYAVAQPQNSNVLIADGGDPLPRPWKALAA